MAFINKIKIGNEIYDILLSTESVGRGLDLNNNTLNVKVGSGLEIDERLQITVKTGLHMGMQNQQIVFQPKLGPSLYYDENGNIRIRIDDTLEINENNVLKLKQ